MHNEHFVAKSVPLLKLHCECRTFGILALLYWYFYLRKVLLAPLHTRTNAQTRTHALLSFVSVRNERA